jgi:hypothetical protein
LKTNDPLGFNPNEPFAGPSKLSAVIASEGSRAASNWQRRIQLAGRSALLRIVAGDPFTLAGEL